MENNSNDNETINDSLINPVGITPGEDKEREVNHETHSPVIIPANLRKTLIVVIIMTIIGFSIILGGIIKWIIFESILQGLPLIILGLFIFIPGFYYTLLFSIIKCCHNQMQRDYLLSTIPEFPPCN